MTRPEKPKTHEAPAAPGQATGKQDDAGDETPQAEHNSSAAADPLVQNPASATLPKEFGGQKGPEPTRYGDWEKNGRCTDF